MKAILLLAAIGSVCTAVSVCAQELKPNTEFRIKLLAPVSTETNQKGDKITAQITSSPEFAGAMMEGEVKESKSGAKLKGTSVRTFAFTSIVQQDQKTAVSSDVKGFVKLRQGKANVDEEGRYSRRRITWGRWQWLLAPVR